MTKSITTDLENIRGIIAGLGFSLDKDQLHIGGERYLMTKNKLVLVGNRLSDKAKVIIKIANHPHGKIEIENEKKSRDLLKSLSFADDSISFPQELYYGVRENYLIFITLFITQEKVFVDHALEEQFFIALKAFEAQENFHATTFEHIKSIEKTFPIWNSKKYIESFRDFSMNKEIHTRSLELIKSNRALIDKYTNYLTHSDFVPHNFRIKNQSLYMLDCSAVQFGNKYEGWARFLNYMIIHNPDIEKALSQYILENRSKEEYLSLKIMRIYKIGFLLSFYAQSLPKTSGDLRTLTESRIDLWHKILESILNEEQLDRNFISSYIKERNTLRSEEEKSRQREFAKA